jgi:hypothetical protein
MLLIMRDQITLSPRAFKKAPSAKRRFARGARTP